MITQDNFIVLLDSLGFSKNKSFCSKTIGSTSLSVDISKHAINYPESEGLIVNERQTCNFYEVANPAQLVDTLDFSRVVSEKQISLSASQKIEVVSKWPLKRASELLEIISGGTPDTGNPAYWNGDIPWLNVADFSTVDRFVSTAEKSITGEGLKNSSTKLLQVGDIIISARGTVGAMAQLTKPMAFNQSCYGLRSKTELSNDYVFYVLKREIEQLKSQSTGSKFKAIIMKTFDEVKLPVPPKKVRGQVVKECEAIDGSAGDIVNSGIPLKQVDEEMQRRKANVFEKYL